MNKDFPNAVIVLSDLAGMYDFRVPYRDGIQKHAAGLRDLVGNYRSAVSRVEAEYQRALQAAADEPIKLAGEQILKLSGLLLNANRSFIRGDKGQLAILDMGDEYDANQIGEMVAKATKVRCDTITKSVNIWYCSFTV